jgi:pimeloyl-ACP methyl ester carboxylesterase
MSQTSEVALSDGVTLWCESAGAGPAVLCIQGVGVAGGGWNPQVRFLAERFHVITFDNRGIGRSGRGAQPLSIQRMAADVWTILDAHGVDACHVIGHSMGGLIALDAALMARHRVKSLSLLCSFPCGSAATQLSLRMAILGLRSRVGTRAMRRQGMLRMIFPAPWLRSVDRVALAARLAVLFGRDLGDSPPIISEQLRAMSSYDARDRLNELSAIPTLVVSGRHDPIAPPAFGRMLAAGFADSRFVEFDEASHALPIQCAERLNELLVEHLTAAERFPLATRRT